MPEQPKFTVVGVSPNQAQEGHTTVVLRAQHEHPQHPDQKAENLPLGQRRVNPKIETAEVRITSETLFADLKQGDEVTITLNKVGESQTGSGPAAQPEGRQGNAPWPTAREQAEQDAMAPQGTAAPYDANA